MSRASKARSTERWLKKHGIFTGPFKRTEGNITFEYDNRTSRRYEKWAAIKRSFGKPWEFSDFYNRILTDEEKRQIKITTLEKQIK
jgi:hypothetical protein